jgi:two-component system, OmpR family, KDP operon response regulator KdpE
VPSEQDAPLVLLVHDTPAIKGALALLLADEGFAMEAVSADDAVPSAIRRLRPALILLHVAGTHERAVSLLREIRSERDEPLIVLSPMGSPAERVRGLELGADDYLVTPFDPDELAARVRAVLRRGERNSKHVPPLVVGDLVIDFDRRILTRDGTVVSLGRTEWLVLRHLARHPGKVVLNTELLSAIWGDGYADDLQVLRICISRLRHKLGASRRGEGPIKTFHNVGYSLETE